MTSMQTSSQVDANKTQEQPLDQPSKQGKFSRFRIYGLQGKLILPYVILTLLLAAIGTYVITQLVTSSLRERFNNQVYETNRLVNDSFVRQERKQLDALRLAVFTQGVPKAMSDRNVEVLDSLLRPVMINQRMEIFTAVDASGHEIFTIGLNKDKTNYGISTGGTDLSEHLLVKSIIRKVSDEQGDKFAEIVKTEMGWVIFSSAPVQDESGTLVGVVMVGSYLNTFVDNIKNEIKADVIVLAPGYEVIATSIPEPDEGFATYQQIARESPDFPQAQAKDTTVNHRPYSISFSNLIVRQRGVGWVGVLLPSNFVVSTESQSRNLFSLVFALGTVAFIILGYVMAQNISRPILRLRKMTQAVAAGDLDQNIALQRSDEIGDLANAFDVMTDHLRDRTAEAARLYAETLQRNKELAEINARLEATQLQLVQSEKLAAIGQLTAGIVHDVKNPFAVIMGMTEVLSDEQLEENVLHGLKVIRESAVKGNTIVSDLLKFARQSKSEMRLNDLRETVEASMRLTAYLTRKYEQIIELPERSLYTCYDSQQIEQVLINMIHNAVQAMPNNGTIRIALKTVDQDAYIEIEDSGSGIAPEHLKRIFDPFFTTKPEGQGTGLGLSVSYGIIANHQGRIEVTSEVGKGTKFTIILPIIKTNYATEGEG
jgi:two-component system, NtrC family, sensor kinase